MDITVLDIVSIKNLDFRDIKRNNLKFIVLLYNVFKEKHEKILKADYIEDCLLKYETDCLYSFS